MESTRSSETSINIYLKDDVTYQKAVISLPYNNHKTAPMNPIARLMDSFHTITPFFKNILKLLVENPDKI